MNIAVRSEPWKYKWQAKARRSLNLQKGISSIATRSDGEGHSPVRRHSQEESKLQCQLRDLQQTKEELSAIIATSELLQKQLALDTVQQQELKAELHAANDSVEEMKRELEARNDR